MTIALALKLFGAALAFAVGIWVGLGTPGMRNRDDRPVRRGRPSNYLHGTWLNRLFFGMPRPPRRFDSGRLLSPSERKRQAKETEKARKNGGDSDRGKRQPVVRFRDR